MTPRPKLRQTVRTRNAVLFYEDKARCRFVVYRRAGGVTRKTSVRYDPAKMWDRMFAHSYAELQAARLKHWPADNLAFFKWQR